MPWIDRLPRFAACVLLAASTLCAEGSAAARGGSRTARWVPAGEGWAANSVNTTVFRRNSAVSFRRWQFIAYYDAGGYVVLGRRRRGRSAWELRRTGFRGRVRDAHNGISLMVDGAGFVHLAWDHHDNPLHYAVGREPLSLEMGPARGMTGRHERRVTYPEFYRLPSGDVLFFFRDGGSGQGNLLVNRYDVRSRSWSQVCPNLLDGEGRRSAYWQAAVDRAGVIHLSWVWRESPDVATNHDLCYARSRDGGRTWERSTGERYTLPIGAAEAEYIARIPCGSELINTCSMTADREGVPYVAAYWREGGGVPQYRILYRAPDGWKRLDTDFRRGDFTLRGTGTRRIPLSRPQLVVRGRGRRAVVTLVFRDAGRGGRVSAAVCRDRCRNAWTVTDLTEHSVGAWEPSYDTELWRRKRRLHLFVQRTEQADAEGCTTLEPQPAGILEVPRRIPR